MRIDTREVDGKSLHNTTGIKQRSNTHLALSFALFLCSEGVNPGPAQLYVGLTELAGDGFVEVPETRCQHSSMSWPGKVTSGLWVLCLAYFLNSWFKKFYPLVSESPKDIRANSHNVEASCLANWVILGMFRGFGPIHCRRLGVLPMRRVQVVNYSEVHGCVPTVSPVVGAVSCGARLGRSLSGPRLFTEEAAGRRSASF